MDYFASFTDKRQLAALHHDPHFHDYLQALTWFWRGNSVASLNSLSGLLAASAEHRFSSALYRLWIEILASTEDRAALDLLAAHLGRIHWEESRHVDMLALRGLIHCELDEWEAVTLLASSLSTSRDSSYLEEFRLRVAQRHGSGSAELQALLQSRELVDYYQWRSAVVGLVQTSDSSHIDAALATVSALFGKSPLEHEVKAYRYIDQGNFREAARHSRWLLRTFHESLDFGVLHTFVLLNLGKTRAARRWLEVNIRTAEGSHDPDLFALASYALRQQERQLSSSSQRRWERAHRYALRAELLYHQRGISCRGLRRPFKLQQALPVDKTSNLLQFAAAGRSISSWLVVVEAGQLHQLLSAPLAELSYRSQQLRTTAKINDLVFIGSAHPWEQGHQRIIALYYVVGRAGWPPRQGCEEFTLKLVKRFLSPLALPLSLAELSPLEVSSSEQLLSAREQVCTLSPRDLEALNHEIAEVLLPGKDESEYLWAKSS